MGSRPGEEKLTSSLRLIIVVINYTSFIFRELLYEENSYTLLIYISSITQLHPTFTATAALAAFFFLSPVALGWLGRLAKRVKGVSPYTLYIEELRLIYGQNRRGDTIIFERRNGKGEVYNSPFCD
uniref:Uncharacterized protein n=1 Tax=Saccharolobus islandicus TaxID=43080 RepID=Q5W2Q8_SACIS|nr:hypothetical protein [Sulfolobus islandicus]